MLDLIIKMCFMFLVGASIPRIRPDSLGYGMLALHILAITVLSNLGKMFPTFCYKQTASLRERFALSIAMFPRGEVGAGILLVTIAYGIKGSAISVAALSLALNLVLTGFFIWAVFQLIKHKTAGA